MSFTRNNQPDIGLTEANDAIRDASTVFVIENRLLADSSLITINPCLIWHPAARWKPSQAVRQSMLVRFRCVDFQERCHSLAAYEASCNTGSYPGSLSSFGG